MDNLQTLLGVAGGIIAVVVALVGLGRAYFKNQELVDRAKIIDENRELVSRVRDLELARVNETKALEDRLAASEAQREQLNDRISLIGRAGGAALALKSALDAELQKVMASFGASGGSIYVPVQGPQGRTRGLAFLCVEPFTAENQKLKSQIIPLHSLAGRCFVSGRSDVELKVPQSGDHYRRAEDISNFRPSSAISIALPQDGRTIGVLQLLRREGEEPFRQMDVAAVATMAGAIAGQVHEVTRTVDGAKLLGLGSEDFVTAGTVLVFDLSQSALLFQELSPSHALILLNEMFEKMCEIAFAHGATLDTYMGDGALLRFNVPKEIADHEYAAVRAGTEMCAAFAEVRTRWLSYSQALVATNLRVGIGSGPLLRGTLGHSQIQHLTILGHPISIAAGLCDAAARDRSLVIAAEETVAPIRARLILEPIETAAFAKAARFTASAYEVLGYR